MAARREMTRRPTPLGAIVRGALGGAVGTVAMDLAQYAQYRRTGGDQGWGEFEFRGVARWDDAPPPAQVGRRLYEGLFRQTLPEEAAGRVNNLVHWAYGMGWGAAYGIVSGSRNRRPRRGIVFATIVWLSGYLILPKTGLYQPITEYDGATLAKDWGQHVIYGLTTARTVSLLGA